jgi:hypothetical protein
MIGRDRFKNRPPKPAQPQPAPQPVQPQPAAQPAQKPRPGKNFGKAVRVEKVKCKCGHEVDFQIFPDKQDRFREDRRKKITDRACPPCRQAAHEELCKKGAKPKTDKKLYRLPHGSVFDIQPFDGEKLQWTASLIVPLPDGSSKTYGPMTRGSIHTLLIKLGKLWRDENPGESTTEPKQEEK